MVTEVMFGMLLGIVTVILTRLLLNVLITKLQRRQAIGWLSRISYLETWILMIMPFSFTSIIGSMAATA